MSKLSQLNEEEQHQCNEFSVVWNALSKVWTLPVIHSLGLKAPARFSELKRRIEGISGTSLSDRLTELEQFHIISRKVYPETPPRVEYQLTEKGLELYGLTTKIWLWVAKWESKD